MDNNIVRAKALLDIAHICTNYAIELANDKLEAVMPDVTMCEDASESIALAWDVLDGIQNTMQNNEGCEFDDKYSKMQHQCISTLVRALYGKETSDNE